MFLALGFLTFLTSIPHVVADGATIEKTDDFDIALGAVLTVFTVIYSTQAARYIWRFIRTPNRRRAVDVTILSSLIVVILFCAVEIALAWLPSSELAAALNTLLTIDAMFYVLSTALLYWGIILYLISYENALYSKTNGDAGKRRFSGTIIHALLFSLRVVLAATDIGLKVQLGKFVSQPNVSQAAEESLTFNLAAVLLLAMVIDVFVYAFSLRKATRDARFNTKLMNIIFYAIAPLFAINASSHLFDFIYDLSTLRMRDFSTIILRLLRDIILNLSFIAIVALLPTEPPAVPPRQDGVDETAPPKEYPNEMKLYSASYPSNASFPAMEPESTSEQALLRILELLKLQEYARQKNNRIADTTTRSQLYSGLSVVAIFIATLSVSILTVTSQPNMAPGQNGAVAMYGALPTAADNYQSCLYMSVFLSLIAGCISGIGAALKNQMANDEADVMVEPRNRSWMATGGPVDRALDVLFFFVCLMLSLAVAVLIFGLLLFVWTTQTPFVAGAMTAPGLAFVLAGGLSVTLWVPRQTRF